jgi:DnaJ-class molecular chaperone
MNECETCHGSGVSDIDHRDTSMLILDEVVQEHTTVYYACPTCGGKGEIKPKKESEQP